MTAPNRKVNMRKLAGFYSIWREVDRYTCFYCGETANNLDHCPPLSIAADIGIEKLHTDNIELLLVPSCAECNRLLSNKKIFTPFERRLEISIKLRSKYKRLLSGADWKDKELEILGPNLKSMVLPYFTKKKLIEKRISYSESLAVALPTTCSK